MAQFSLKPNGPLQRVLWREFPKFFKNNNNVLDLDVKLALAVLCYQAYLTMRPDITGMQKAVRENLDDFAWNFALLGVLGECFPTYHADKSICDLVDEVLQDAEPHFRPERTFN